MLVLYGLICVVRLIGGVRQLTCSFTGVMSSPRRSARGGGEVVARSWNVSEYVIRRRDLAVRALVRAEKGLLGFLESVIPF